MVMAPGAGAGTVVHSGISDALAYPLLPGPALRKPYARERSLLGVAPHRRKPRPSGPITRRAGLFFSPGLDGQAEASKGAREVFGCVFPAKPIGDST